MLEVLRLIDYLLGFLRCVHLVEGRLNEPFVKAVRFWPNVFSIGLDVREGAHRLVHLEV